jgi:hypothetical protein
MAREDKKLYTQDEFDNKMRKEMEARRLDYLMKVIDSSKHKDTDILSHVSIDGGAILQTHVQVGDLRFLVAKLREAITLGKPV